MKLSRARIALISGALVAVAILWFAVLRDKVDTSTDRRPEVKIGVVLPLSGPTSRYGTWIRNALEMAKDEHNQSTNHPFRITYIYEDDAGQASNATSATRKLIAVDQVPAIFGTWSSAGVLAMAPIVEENRIVLMADAVSPQVRDAGEWVFRCVPDARLSLGVLEEPVRTAGHRRIAIVFIDNEFGRDLASYMATVVRAGGTEVVLNEGYPAATTDFRGVVARVKQASPDAWFIAGYAEQGNLMRQAREAGLTLPTYASPSFENPDILAAAAGTAAGVIYPNYFDPASEVETMRAFLERYQERFNEPAEGFGASAYAGIQVLISALTRAESRTSVGIREALENSGRFQTVFGETWIDETGDLRYPVFLKTVRNGTFVRYTVATPVAPAESARAAPTPAGQR
jgi:branched-chain amino acid transport system substrate-binding protein